MQLWFTWRGCYDDVPGLYAMLQKLGTEFPWIWSRKVHYTLPDGTIQEDVRRGFWVHVDGALGASYAPFVEMAYNLGIIDKHLPIFDFRNECVMSVCTSFHKWLGSPWPGGIYMTRTDYQLLPPETVGYIGSADTTLGGSRSAFTPLLFWAYLSKTGYKYNIKKSLDTLFYADYLYDSLAKLQVELKEKYPDEDNDIWLSRSYLSLAIRFRMPCQDLIWAYTVDTERLTTPLNENEQQDRTFAHIYTMWSLTPQLVDEFVSKLRFIAINEGFHAAFPDKDEAGNPNPGPVVPIKPQQDVKPEHFRKLQYVPITGRGFGFNYKTIHNKNQLKSKKDKDEE